MKLVFSILIVAAAVLFSQAKTREEMKARWQELAAECQKTTGASDDELEKIIMHAKPETHDGKCMIACILETIGVVKDGKICKEGLEAWQKESPIPAEVIQTAVSECDGITDSDHCEAATEIGHCFKETFKKAGLFPED